MVRITVITVCYNAERTIRETIESVVNQKYPNLEYIIVDGMSTDGTVMIVDEYRDRITKVISAPPKGISNAFNTGIQHATGEIIGLINADDKLADGALAKINDAYDPCIDIYRGHTIIWNDITGYMGSEKPDMDFKKFSLHPHIAHQSTFVTKRAYEKFGLFDEQCKYCMDWDFLLRAGQNGARMKYIPSNLAWFRTGGISGASDKLRVPEFCYVLKKNGVSVWGVMCFRTARYGISIAKWVADRIDSDLRSRLQFRRIRR